MQTIKWRYEWNYETERYEGERWVRNEDGSICIRPTPGFSSRLEIREISDRSNLSFSFLKSADVVFLRPQQ